MEVQIIPDFIIEHHIKVNDEVDINLLSPIPWRLYFDGSVCSN
jgi:hypothetical protein